MVVHALLVYDSSTRAHTGTTIPIFVHTYLSLSTGFNVGRVWLEVTTPTAGIESASDTLRAMLPNQQPKLH